MKIFNFTCQTIQEFIYKNAVYVQIRARFRLSSFEKSLNKFLYKRNMNITALILLFVALPYTNVLVTVKNQMIQLYEIIKQLLIIGCLSTMYWFWGQLAVTFFGFWMQFHGLHTGNVYGYWRALSLSTFAIFCMTQNICLSFTISLFAPHVGKMLVNAVARKGSKAD